MAETQQSFFHLALFQGFIQHFRFHFIQGLIVNVVGISNCTQVPGVFGCVFSSKNVHFLKYFGRSGWGNHYGNLA